MMLYARVLAVVLLVALCMMHADAQVAALRGGALPSQVNSADEDYGPVLVYGRAADTLYFTSSREVGGRPRRALNAELMFSVRGADQRSLPPNEGWSDARQVMIRDSMFAAYTRGLIAMSADSQRAVYVAQHNLISQRSAGVTGTSYNLQLWQMRRDSAGMWASPEELAALIDTTSWNSQPAFSTDGHTLFFVSNRAGGAGGLDIWYSVYDVNSGWSKPRPATEINTPGDEVSPHCGIDGKFYFASDWDRARKALSATARDLYRCEFRRIDGVNLPVEPVNVDTAIHRDARAVGNTVPDGYAINSAGNDEFPFIARGRTAIYFTSDRAGGAGRRDLYALELPKPRVFLYVTVRERTTDSTGAILVSAHEKPGFPVTVVDSATGTGSTVRSGAKGELEPGRTYYVSIDPRLQDECYDSRVEGAERQIVRTGSVPLHDTTHLRSFLITRRPVVIPPVVFYSTDTLPYFITGYWWPNTTRNLQEYRKREASGFFDKSGFVDSSGHDYAAIARRIDSAFDHSIYAPLRRLLTQFQRECGDTLYLKVTVHGYTDPRPLSTGTDHRYRQMAAGARIYPDSTVTAGVDEHGAPVTIRNGSDMWLRSWPRDPAHPDGAQVVLPDTGQQGNVLLSKLRAFYTFTTFDAEMRRQSEQYDDLIRQHRVLTDIEGYGVDVDGYNERHLRDDPQSRRIEIYLDVLRKEEVQKHRRAKGGRVVN